MVLELSSLGNRWGQVEFYSRIDCNDNH